MEHRKIKRKDTLRHTLYTHFTHRKKKLKWFIHCTQLVLQDTKLLQCRRQPVTTKKDKAQTKYNETRVVLLKSDFREIQRRGQWRPVERCWCWQADSFVGRIVSRDFHSSIVHRLGHHSLPEFSTTKGFQRTFHSVMSSSTSHDNHQAFLEAQPRATTPASWNSPGR